MDCSTFICDFLLRRFCQFSRQRTTSWKSARLRGGVMLQPLSAPITERHSLSPASSARCPNSAPCGDACLRTRRNVGFTMFRLNDTNELAPASTPAACVSVCPILSGGATDCVPFG